MKLWLCFVVVLMFSVLHADGVQPAGNGTEGDTYLVETLDNLLWVSTNDSCWGDWFVQTADINAYITQTWNNGEGFSPIGVENNHSAVFYDGQNHVIDSLYINRPESSYQGLFGHSGSMIFNLGLTNVFICGNNYVGGLSGGNAVYQVNCFTTGTITGNTYVGGLAGYAEDVSYMNACFSSAQVQGSAYVGGLIGQMGQMPITCNQSFNCSHELQNPVRMGVLSNSYFNGSVLGGNAVGGIIGVSEYNTISKCYSTGFVSGTGSTGGLLGSNDYSAVTASFWDTQTSGQSSSSGGTGLTFAQMQYESTYTDAGWDFLEESANGDEDIWGLNPDVNGGYPFLAWLGFSHNPPQEAVQGGTDTPLATRLRGNYPNPFNPTTTIRFSVRPGDTATLEVYNVRGQRVCGWSGFGPGEHAVAWNGRDDGGRAVGSGVYFCRLSSGGNTQTHKMLLLK